MPAYTVASHNVRGFQAYGKISRTSQGAGKAANACALANNHDITFFQETNLLDREDRYLKKILPPGFSDYYSSLNSTTAGVAIVVSPKIASTHTIAEIPLPPCLQGYALLLELTPKDGATFYVLNVYFDSHSSANRTKQILTLNRALPYMHFLILGGDFNFVEDKHHDTSTHSKHYDSTKAFAQAWGDFKSKLRLKEVFQRTHTFVSGRYLETTVSSRLDRFYISYSEADWATTRPYAYISSIPHSLLRSKVNYDLDPNQADNNNTINTVNADTNSHTTNTKSFDFTPSDHFPITLAFKPDTAEEAPRPDPRIPEWVPADPAFVPIFEQRWRDIAHKLDPEDPFAAHAALKTCMYDAAQEVIVAARKKKKRYSDDVHRLTALLRLHREMDRAARFQDHTRLARYSAIHSTLPTDHDEVREAIRALLSTGSIERQARKPGASSIRQSSAVDKIKLHLPSTMVRLRALREEPGSAPTSDPDLMARYAAAYWSKIWARRTSSDRIDPGTYFGFFQKSLPDGPLPVIPSVQDISDSIARPKKSCAGPDGIPFSVWRALREHAAPVLHMVVVALAAGVLPPADFNNGLLFLLPKNGSLLPTDTRPISVTNADNRIIAQAVVQSITPYLYKTLEGAQKGFISERAFEDHIRAINEAFYSAVEGDQGADNLYILFMDTAKAFDSIDHSFIMTALKRAGLPDWLVTLVAGLLHDVKVKPAFRGASAHWINILRGVKQGCPLSPLLFVICYDILLYRISRTSNATPYACADDLAVATEDPRALWKVMALVDLFRRASGLGVNTNKTKILCAKNADLAPSISACPWPDVQVALSYTYLGVLIGRHVTVLDVFAKAVAGLVDRVTRYAPAMKHLSHMHMQGHRLQRLHHHQNIIPHQILHSSIHGESLDSPPKHH